MAIDAVYSFWSLNWIFLLLCLVRFRERALLEKPANELFKETNSFNSFLLDELNVSRIQDTRLLVHFKYYFTFCCWYFFPSKCININCSFFLWSSVTNYKQSEHFPDPFKQNKAENHSPLGRPRQEAAAPRAGTHPRPSRCRSRRMLQTAPGCPRCARCSWARCTRWRSAARSSARSSCRSSSPASSSSLLLTRSAGRDRLWLTDGSRWRWRCSRWSTGGLPHSHYQYQI